MLITLHKLEFAERYTAMFLTLENKNREHSDIFFEKTECRAIQQKKRFGTTLERPKHREIKFIIPGGIEEQGVVKFEPLDCNEESSRKAKDKSAIDSSLMFPSLRLILIRDPYLLLT